VRNGENGFIIKFKDSHDIAEKIEKLINHEELRMKMGESSQKKALEMSWKNVAGEYYDLYKKIKN
jgi:glycosyltransferase involved in cell wall biosynthesis